MSKQPDAELVHERIGFERMIAAFPLSRLAAICRNSG